MTKETRRIFLPVTISFIVITGLIIIFKNLLSQYGFDTQFLLVANLFFFLLSLGGFVLQLKGLRSDNPNAFVRGVYASMLLKLFVSIIVVSVYAFIKSKNINRPGVFFSMGLYIIYTSIEVYTLMKMARQKSNAKETITS